MKKILIALIALIGWISTAFAENFDIINYDIQLNVDLDNKISIEEDIDTDFHIQSHGIFRTIPLVNNVIRADGTKYTTFAKVSNLYVNNNYTTSYEGNNLKIKIGNPNKLIFGRQNYNISYVYELTSPKSEFYFNIIGTGWNTDIKKVHFKVQMPKSFPYDKVGISMGENGTVGFKDDAEFKVDKNTNSIEGETLRTLGPHEALTIRVELPKNYFNKKKLDNNKPLVCFWTSIFLGICLIYWYIYGKDEKAISVVNFYPPKNLNSAVVGMIYKEGAEIEQVVSLLIYLADKGYIRIEDKETYSYFIKLKDYEGKSKECSMFMNALFSKKDKIATTELETSRTFYVRCYSIIDYLNKTKKFLYEKDSISLKTIIPVLLSNIGLLAMLVLVLINFEINQVDKIAVFTFLPLFLIPLIFAFISFLKMPSESLMYKFIFFVFFTLIIGGLIFAVLQELIMSFQLNPYLCSFCFISLIIGLICLYNLPKKNQQYLRLLGHILGYKKFLETAEKRKLEELVKDNPQYFFNMLPYAYVLGVSDVWIEKFRNIIGYQPEWYQGRFNLKSFLTLTNTMKNLSCPTYANGGISRSSSGGGGRSGGGSGGGGGGSW